MYRVNIKINYIYTFMLYTKIEQIIQAFTINYKTWILYLATSYILCDYNVFIGMLCFMYTYYVSYLGHYFIHINCCYTNIYAISHYYHHLNTGIFSLIISGITEFLMLANNIITKHIFINFNFNSLNFINEWIILYVYLLYTTTHNINYGIYKVNNYHTLHHESESTNIGFDFFDMIFGTKNSKTPEIEMVDHMIPNIIFSFFVVYGLKQIYDSSELNKQKYYQYGFGLLWAMCSCTLLLSSIKILYLQINEILEVDLHYFIHKIK